MRTPEEIKKGLECCFPSEDPDCFECPYKATEICFDARINDILAYIQQLEAAAPKWISVEERLPKKGEWVIAHDKSGEMFIGELHVVDKGRKSVYCESGYDAFFDITHWMPLPEPPKEEE